MSSENKWDELKEWIRKGMIRMEEQGKKFPEDVQRFNDKQSVFHLILGKMDEMDSL